MKKTGLPFQLEKAFVVSDNNRSRKPQGVFVPIGQTIHKLKEMNLSFGQMLFFEVTLPRTVEFNGKAHILGKVVSEVIPGFEHFDAHKVLKRLQIEGNIACEEIAIQIRGIEELVVQRIPKSLAFDKMDENEFRDVYKQFCDFILEKYWHKIHPANIKKIAPLIERH